MAKFFRLEHNDPKKINYPSKQKALFNWFIDDEDLLNNLVALGINYKYGYTVDDDYQQHVFKGVTEADVRYICSRLNSESKDGRCTRAELILAVLDGKDQDRFWRTHLACYLSYVRRTACGCHNPGCFHVRSQ